MNPLAALLAGTLFGFGLAVSGMSDPQNVLDFLTISDQWNPALLLVMASALAVTAIGYRWVRLRSAPLWADVFHLPTRQDVDFKLVSGAVTFGAGWGLAGYCPGPALVGSFALDGRALTFLAAFMVGVAGYEVAMKYVSLRPSMPVSSAEGDG